MSNSEEVESLLKRYFPVILKPIVLTVLVFVLIAWLYLALFAVSPTWFVDLEMPPEMRDQEAARASNLGSFLANVVRGNFGFSFVTRRQVWGDATGRWPATLLLIGLSTVCSVVIGVGLSFLFKPGRQKPTTFAHALRAFFFGLAPLLALVVLLLFCYYPYAISGATLFPVRGLYSLPPPAEPIEYAADVAWHLVLPVGTLTLIGVLRILFVLWSSGSTFATRPLLKKVLLPWTTIDFALLISATIGVEYVFTLPGLGQWFLTSLMAADFNALVGAFVMLLILALGLGYLAVFLDFLQRLLGLTRDLQMKITVASDTTSSQPKGIIPQYLTAFLRRKKLVIGSAIVISLLVLAASAPVIAPSDPLVSDSVASPFAGPQWLTILPEFSNRSTTQETLLYWNVDEGAEFVKGYGTQVAVEYDAQEVTTATVELSATFSYRAVPPTFSCRFNWTTRNVHDVTYSLRLMLSTPEGGDYALWVQPPLDVARSDVVVLDAADPRLKQQLGFGLHENIASILFAQAGEYTTRLQLQFSARSASGRCTVALRDAEFVLLGDVYGILGTDHVGRDVFTQLVHGARTTMAIVLLVALGAVVASFPLGVLTGYFQGWLDTLITPVVEAVLLLPILPIALVYLFVVARSWVSSLSLSLWFLFALAMIALRTRFLVRSRHQKFRGTTTITTSLNVGKDLLGNWTLTAISALLLSVTIDFLGFGDPTIPSLGRLLHDAFGFGGFTRLAWWWILSPVVYLGVFALGLLLVSTGLDD